MTVGEDSELNISHLSAYLPYKIMVKKRYVDWEYDWDDLHPIPMSYGYLRELDDPSFELKPILHPLSDLTKEMALACGYFPPNAFNTFLKEIKTQNVSVQIWNDLLKNHWDVFGLIDKGLAIDINTLQK